MSLTIGIPGTSSTNFATSPHPSLAIRNVTADQTLSLRSSIEDQQVLVGARSLSGTAELNGTVFASKLAWEINTVFTDADIRLINALKEWQDAAYRSGSDGALRLIDQHEYLWGETSPHSRTLLSSISESYNASVVYGHGVFSVALTLPNNWRQSLGPGYSTARLQFEEL